MPMPRSSFLCFTALVLTACTPHPPSPPAPNPAMAVNASFGRTWNAAIDVFAARNIPIETLDRASGLIVAQPEAVPSPQNAAARVALADCGSDALGTQGYPETAYYNVLVRGDSVRSTVHVTVKWIGDLGTVCSTRGIFEQGFAESVKQKAEVSATTAGQTAH